jgi:hypothetical protein
LEGGKNRFGDGGVSAADGLYLPINLCVFPALRAIAIRTFALIVPSVFARVTHGFSFL